MISQSRVCPIQVGRDDICRSTDSRLLCPETARNWFESIKVTLPTVPNWVFLVDRVDRPVQNIPDFARSTRQPGCAVSARRRSKPVTLGFGSGGFRYLPARRPTLNEYGYENRVSFDEDGPLLAGTEIDMAIGSPDHHKTLFNGCQEG
jgi:hypothetical protein